jgi:hypothetical protein
MFFNIAFSRATLKNMGRPGYKASLGWYNTNRYQHTQLLFYYVAIIIIMMDKSKNLMTIYFGPTRPPA